MEQNKNNPIETPQTDGDVNAGGQVDLEALKAQIASQATPSETTEQGVPMQTKPEETSPVVPEKKYAGKFTDPNALEEGYVNLEKKIGVKTDLERVGEKLYKYSGRDLQTLEQELDVALMQQVTPTVPNQAGFTQTTTDPEVARLSKQLEAIQIENLKRQLAEEKSALFAEFPEAKNQEKNLDDFWKSVDTKSSYRDIYVNRFASVEQAKRESQEDKAKENFSVASAVGTEQGNVGDVDVSKLSVEQLRSVLPKANNY